MAKPSRWPLVFASPDFNHTKVIGGALCSLSFFTISTLLPVKMFVRKK